MKTAFKLALLAGCALLGCLHVGKANESGVNTNQIRQYIAQLGAADYRTRREAFEFLQKQNREILPLLWQSAKTTDPEIRESAQALIRVLLANPANIPQRFYVVTDQATENIDYDARLKRWNEAAFRGMNASILCVSNLTGQVGGAYHGQGFVTHCDTIAAAVLSVYPVNPTTHGWLRLDLCDDKRGRPGNVLARCWLRIENFTLPMVSFTAFNFPEIPVASEAKHWLHLQDFPDSDCTDGVIYNVGMSDGDQYRDGAALDESSGDSENLDLLFGITSNPIEFPLIHHISADEAARLPHPPPALANH